MTNTNKSLLHRLVARFAVVRAATLVLSLLSLAYAGACTEQPLDQATINSRVQTYSGYHTDPNIRISIQVRNRVSLAWDVFASTFTAKTPAFTDACGKPWYRWQTPVLLPPVIAGNNPGPYWARIFQPGVVLTQTRAVAGSALPMASFRAGANECIEQNQCGIDARNNCGDPAGNIVLFCRDADCR